MIKTRYSEYPDYIIKWDRKLNKCSCGSEIILMLNFHKELPAACLCCGKGNDMNCTETTLFKCDTQKTTLNALNSLYKNYKKYIVGHEVN